MRIPSPTKKIGDVLFLKDEWLKQQQQKESQLNAAMHTNKAINIASQLVQSFLF